MSDGTTKPAPQATPREKALLQAVVDHVGESAAAIRSEAKATDEQVALLRADLAALTERVESIRVELDERLTQVEARLDALLPEKAQKPSGWRLFGGGH